MSFYHNSESGLNMLIYRTDYVGVKYSVGLFIDENYIITSSTLVFETATDCMKEAMKRRRVFRDFKKKECCTRNPTIKQ